MRCDTYCSQVLAHEHQSSCLQRATQSSRRQSQRAKRRLDQLSPASIVDIWDVLEMTSLSRATIYRKMEAGTFPSNRKLSVNRAGWRLADVLVWLENPR